MKHLSSVLDSKGYPYSFVVNITQSNNQNPQSKLNLQQFYHTSKGYLNHLVVAYNSMAYDLFSSPIRH